MVTTFTIEKATATALLLAAVLGCSGTQNGSTEPTCGEKYTSIVFEPQLSEKGDHTIVVTFNGTTITCDFNIDSEVTPLDGRCDGPSADLRIPSYTPAGSPQSGPDNLLPIVEGVWIFGVVDEVTVEVDGTSYGPLSTEHVNATEDACAHVVATIQLD